MEDRHQERNIEFYDFYWSTGTELYEAHPTSRHRRRFVRRCLRGEKLKGSPLVFDYGCGTGAMLREAGRILQIDNSHLRGCDISERSISLVEKSLPGGIFYLGAFPRVSEKADIVICSEVIEHTSEYRKILRWISDNIKEGGLLVLSTPRVPMDIPDQSYGHVQHFQLSELRRMLESLDFRIEKAREWGFPFFSMQKWVTALFFNRIRQSFLERPMSRFKHGLFSLVYYLYFVHDLIPRGPQLFLSARKK